MVHNPYVSTTCFLQIKFYRHTGTFICVHFIVYVFFCAIMAELNRFDRDFYELQNLKYLLSGPQV